MSTNILGSIEKIGIVDDNEEGRNTLSYIVEDASLEPILQNESVTNLEEYLTSLRDNFDGIVTDHHLRKVKSYFPIDGAEFAAKCYGLNIPSLLVTRYEQSEILEIRKFREHIPVVLTPDEYDPDSLIAGLVKCMNEFNGILTMGRKSWRTLIRVDDVKEDKNIYIIIPAWNSQQAISLNMNNLPENLQKVIKPDMRFFAKVNIGNENSNELFIKDWEY
jgi:CheY-like chemotaxis protein